jgi:hypothetical protein
VCVCLCVCVSVCVCVCVSVCLCVCVYVCGVVNKVIANKRANGRECGQSFYKVHAPNIRHRQRKVKVNGKLAREALCARERLLTIYSGFGGEVAIVLVELR